MTVVIMWRDIHLARLCIVGYPLRLNPTIPIKINHSAPNLFQEFGWPKKIKREGFFWSTKFSKSRLKKMIANIFKLDNKRWIFKLNKFKKDICFQDKFFSKKTNNIIISYFK